MSAKRVTIFTSNCQIEDLRHDDRIINRIQKMALPVPFPEQSIRAELAAKEAEFCGFRQNSDEEILRSFLEG
jgi:DNA replication protein DnaC